MTEVERLDEILMKKLNGGIDQDPPFINSIERDRNMGERNITIDLYGKPFDIELRISNGKIFGLQRIISHCEKCGNPEIKRKWIRIKDFNNFQDIYKKLFKRSDKDE